MGWWWNSVAPTENKSVRLLQASHVKYDYLQYPPTYSISPALWQITSTLVLPITVYVHDNQQWASHPIIKHGFSTWAWFYGPLQHTVYSTSWELLLEPFERKMTWNCSETFSLQRGYAGLALRFSQWQRHRGTWGICPPISQKSAKIVKENGMKLVGYAFRLKKYVKIPPPPPTFLSDFSELVPPLDSGTVKSQLL